MMNNDINKGLITKTYIYLFILLLLSAALIYVDVFARENFPPVYEIKPESSDSAFITFSDSEDMRIIRSTYYAEVDAGIDDGIENQFGIKTVLTNGKYDDLYGMEFAAGVFFDDEMVSTQMHCAVISEQLSKDLFLSSNAVGKAIYIDGSKYTIIGVCKENNSFWAKLSLDRYDRIYIPYTTYPGYRDLKLDALAVDNVSQKASIDKLLVEYPGLVDGNINIDYGVKLRYCTQFPDLIKFIAKTAILLFLIILAYKTIKASAGLLYSQRRTSYLKDIIKKNIKLTGIVSFIILAMTSILVIMIKKLHFPLYIPGAFLPKENLFDIKYYMDEISAFFMKDNSILTPGNNFYFNLVNMTLAAEIELSVLVSIFMFLMLVNFRKLACKSQILAVELLGYFGIIILLSFTLKLITGMMFMSGLLSIMAIYAALFVATLIYEVSVKYISSLFSHEK